MKQRALPGAVSPAAPRKSIPTSLENRGRERERERKKRMEEENPPSQQCRTITTVTTAKHTLKGRAQEREGKRERDGVKMREHEAIERLFILSLPGVATDSGIKIEPIAVNMRSVSPRGKQRRREIQSERE